MGQILFEEMGLEGGEKTKTGQWSTPAEVLEDLAATHDFATRVLDYRQLQKLKSTYTDALQDHINPETGRVHTSYVIAGANTGRLASTDPNLQNIPVRSERVAASARLSSHPQARFWSPWTIPRSNCASWRISQG